MLARRKIALPLPASSSYCVLISFALQFHPPLLRLQLHLLRSFCSLLPCLCLAASDRLTIHNSQFLVELL